MVSKCLFRRLGGGGGSPGDAEPRLWSLRGPGLEECPPPGPQSTKAAQFVRDPTLGALGDLTLQEGLVSSLTALPLGSAGTTVYFILFPLPPRRAPGSRINDFDASRFPGDLFKSVEMHLVM